MRFNNQWDSFKHSTGLKFLVIENSFAFFTQIESRRLDPLITRRKRRDTSTNPNHNFLQRYVATRHTGSRRRTRRALTPTCTAFPVVSTHLAGPYSTFVTLKNLKKYTRYQITVRVYNSYSDGPKSWPPKVLITPQDGKILIEFLLFLNN